MLKQPSRRCSRPSSSCVLWKRRSIRPWRHWGFYGFSTQAQSNPSLSVWLCVSFSYERPTGTNLTNCISDRLRYLKSTVQSVLYFAAVQSLYDVWLCFRTREILTILQSLQVRLLRISLRLVGSQARGQSFSCHGCRVQCPIHSDFELSHGDSSVSSFSPILFSYLIYY